MDILKGSVTHEEVNSANLGPRKLGYDWIPR